MQNIVRHRLVSIGLLMFALAVSALFIALGFWQLDRAAQKRTSFEEFQRRGEAAQIDLNLSSVGEADALTSSVVSERPFEIANAEAFRSRSGRPQRGQSGRLAVLTDFERKLKTVWQSEQ